MWTPGLTLEYIERQAIESALKFYHGNKKQVAQSLGVALRTIDNKIEKYAKEDAAKIEKQKEREEKLKAGELL